MYALLTILYACSYTADLWRDDSGTAPRKTRYRYGVLFDGLVHVYVHRGIDGDSGLLDLM